MTEIVIFGRGGQGGVTLAKLIAMTHFLQDQYAQAFGVYAAERSGAPVRAFVRIDTKEITCRNQIYEPDHVVVLERTLIDQRVSTGLKPGGWVVLNTPLLPEDLVDRFHGYRIATVDANALAIRNNLGTRTTPIVNTTMLGAVARVFSEPFEIVQKALAETGFLGGNLEAARLAYESVRIGPPAIPSEAVPSSIQFPGTSLSILDPSAGELPAIKTGTWATQRPRQVPLQSPCNGGCPAGNDVRGFLAAVTTGRLDDALAILHQTSPFPGICGRVCPAPCMEACHRSHLDGPVNVRELERYVADHARPDVVFPVPTSRERVAVVGSGPAGLSACYHLAKLGYGVRLFESQTELGGVLRYGIPSYRLPREILDREIAFVLAHGVEVDTGKAVGKSDLLRRSHQFAAIFVGTGLQELRTLNLGNRDPAVVLEGVAFLDASRSGAMRLDGRRIVVIGGGNTAVDAARTARRLGATEVRIVYRRTRSEMPAIGEEIQEALEEGVILTELLAPLCLTPKDAHWQLVCRKMRLGEPDQSGRRSPVAVGGPDGVVEVGCDQVILALGQAPDLSVFPEGTEIMEEGRLLGLVGAPVFAGGDLHRNEGTVAAAVGSGRKAAWHIHRTLSGQDLFPPVVGETVPLKALRLKAFPPRLAHTARLRPPLERLLDFDEVRLGFSEGVGHELAMEESSRCFSCGSCTSCDICRTHCPEGILVRRGNEYSFNYDYCKGCGLCASECPRGVIVMEQL